MSFTGLPPPHPPVHKAAPPAAAAATTDRPVSALKGCVEMQEMAGDSDADTLRSDGICHFMALTKRSARCKLWACIMSGKAPQSN